MNSSSAQTSLNILCHVLLIFCTTLKISIRSVIHHNKQKKLYLMTDYIYPYFNLQHYQQESSKLRQAIDSLQNANRYQQSNLDQILQI
jgi:hypothetical protein